MAHEVVEQGQVAADIILTWTDRETLARRGVCDICHIRRAVWSIGPGVFLCSECEDILETRQRHVLMEGCPEGVIG